MRLPSRLHSLYTFVSMSFHCMAGTVLLHLFAGSLARRQPNLNTKSKPIQSLYIPVPSPFPALESFIDQCAEAYNLDLFHCVPDRWNKGDVSGSGNGNGAVSLPVESTASPEPSLSPGIKDHVDVDAATIHHAVGKSKGGEGMRRGLELYKKKYPNVDAILVGTRRGDPHGGEYFSFPLRSSRSPLLLILST